jgi:phage terminase large subunit-like protein
MDMMLAAGRRRVAGEHVAGWARQVIDGARVSARVAELPDLERVVVAVVPGMPGHMTGIAVAGRAPGGHIYVLGDYSMAGDPAECMEAVVAAYREHNADVIAGVVNLTGDYLDELLFLVDDEVRYEAVAIRKGMAARVAPVGALYEQGLVHHAGVFTGLEKRMGAWTTRTRGTEAQVNALVCAVTELESR